MIKCTYIFLILFFSIFLQILIGNSGVIFPITALCIFYITVVFNWRTGIITAILSGTIIDILYGRTIFIAPVVLLIIVFFALLWLHKGEVKTVIIQVLPAAFTGIIYTCPELFFVCRGSEHGYSILFYKLLLLFLSVIFAIIIFPPLIIMLDKLNVILKINEYTKIREIMTRK